MSETVTTELSIVWRRLVADLPPSQRAWLDGSMPVTLHENTAIIAVANDFTRDQIEGRLRTHLEDALGTSFDRPIRIAVTVDSQLNPGPRHAAGSGLESTQQLDDLSTKPQVGMATGSVMETRLNPKYIFETFVIGSSNRFAHAAAVAVAEAPGKAYNPLLIYGDSGLGKTHLLHAIGHYVRSLFAGSRVRYVSSEEFTNEFINAIRDDKQDRFKRRYR
ncbi:MAG: DnaA ATPase domain-containing protein, partial [Sciscionella sp.]